MKIIDYYPLSSRVLAVAVEGEIGDWTAYIDAVPGICHKDEAEYVAKNGTKLQYEISKILFQNVDSTRTWRE